MKNSLPFSDLEDLSAEDRATFATIDEPLSGSHTLETQIGGQLTAGFHLVGCSRTTAPTR